MSKHATRKRHGLFGSTHARFVRPTHIDTAAVAQGRAASARRAARRGSVALEFMLFFFVALLLLVGMWEIGRVVQVRQVLAAAARSGGRQVSAGAPLGNVPTVQTPVPEL